MIHFQSQKRNFSSSVGDANRIRIRKSEAKSLVYFFGFFFESIFAHRERGGAKTAPSIAYKPANRFAGAGYAQKRLQNFKPLSILN
jgi:hypothetical protein